MRLTLPDNAPFSGPQRLWLRGFLDGVSSTLAGSTGGSTAPPAAEPPPAGIPLTLAYGSQTGNAESLCKKLAKKLTAQGHLPAVKDMGDLSVADLSGIGHLLIITSTYGDGEPPDNAAALHRALHSTGAPALPHLRYSVLALGDSNYPDFCKCGRDFDHRLTALGAARLTDIVECDVDYDGPFSQWLAQLEKSLAVAA